MSGYFARLMAKATPVAAAPRAASAVAPLEQVVEVESVPVGVARPVASAPAEVARGVEQAVSSAPGPTVQREGLPAALSSMPLPASMPARSEPQGREAPVRGTPTQALSSTAPRSELPTSLTPSLAQPVSSTLPGIETALPGLQTIHTETRIPPEAGVSTPSAVRSVDVLDLQATLPMQTATHATADAAARATPVIISGAPSHAIDAAPSSFVRADAVATPLAPLTPSRRDSPARPDVHIGTVSLEVRLPPPAAPAARPAP
ncbi:hypothetical protein, partial [Rhizobacter sp. P5_C2]